MAESNKESSLLSIVNLVAVQTADLLPQRQGGLRELLKLNWE